MKESLNNKSDIIEQKIFSLKSLIEQKEFKLALAELRDLENQKDFGKFVDESEDFCYLFALTFQGLGNYKEACSKAKKALDLLRSSPHFDKFARVQYVLGTIYFDMGELKKAEQELRDAIAYSRRINDQKGIIDVLNELAHLHFVTSDYFRAIEYLKECIICCDQIDDSTTKAKVSANLGRIYIRMGNWKLAKVNLEEAAKIHEESGNKVGFCNGLLSLGYVYSQQRDFKGANKFFEQSIKLILENNYAREFAIYHEYAGELEFAQDNYDEAQNHYLTCIGAMEIIAPEGDMISQTYRLLAELQIAEKQYDKALSSCEKALKVAESLGEKIEIGAIHRALGQIYSALNQIAQSAAKEEKAQENFKKSISVLDQIGAKFELGKAYLEAGKSNCYDFLERVQYLGKAKDIFEELNSRYHEGLVQWAISKLLYENEEPEKSLLFLNDAEKIFKESKEDKGLSSILSFQQILKRTLGKSECVSDAQKDYTFSNIITQNQKMLDLLENIKRAKDSDMTMLLEGETGTGKDLLAKTIHDESKRKNKKFVVALCSSIPETLLENALFGHVKGAYTGANESSVGLFEEASGGTLYLDEIAEIPLSTQVKLLRAIDEKEITRIGETKPRKVEMRIIASTSLSLSERVESGLFRKDLYFRLNALCYKLPPLRERKEDIPLLIEYFLRDNAGDSSVLRVLGNPGFIEQMHRHTWPGNVRELKHQLEKIAVLSGGDSSTDMSLLNFPSQRTSEEDGNLSLYDQMAEFEKKRIDEALKSTNGNKSQAAKLLNIPLSSLISKIEKHRILP